MKNWSRNAQKFFGQEYCSNYSPISLLQRGSVNVFLDSVFFVVTVKGQLVDSFGRHCIQATPQQQCFFCNFSCTCFFRPCFLLKYTRFCASVQLALKVETSCGKFLWAINTITCIRVLFFSFFRNCICEMNKSLSERFLEVINAIISSGVRFCKFELQQVESSRESQIK